MSVQLLSLESIGLAFTGVSEHMLLLSRSYFILMVPVCVCELLILIDMINVE